VNDDEFEVRFLLIGGEAVIFHGEAELPYLSLVDLVNAKRAAGRPKDLQDLIYLEPLLRKEI